MTLIISDFVLGIVGNWIARHSDPGARSLAEIIFSRLTDRGNALPPNHDIDHACRTSLKQALAHFAQTLELQVHRPKTLLEAIGNRTNEDGLWKPIIEWWRTDEGAWFDEFVQAIQSDQALTRFELPRLSVTSVSLPLSGLSDPQLEEHFHLTLLDWTERFVQKGSAPSHFEVWVRNGWPVAGGSINSNLTVYKAWCLFLQDHIKKNDPVFRILTTEWLATIDSRFSTLVTRDDLVAALQMSLGDHCQLLLDRLSAVDQILGEVGCLGPQIGMLVGLVLEFKGEVNKQLSAIDAKLTNSLELLEQLTRGQARNEDPEIADSIDSPQVSLPRLSLGRLPVPPDESLFVGRLGLIGFLDAAWENASPSIIQLVGDGGVGKSTVLWHWLRRIQRTGYREILQAIDWSFYSQGRHEYVADSAGFLAEAQQHFSAFGNQIENSAVSCEKVGRIVGELFVASGGLMLLDGVEPLQHPPEVKDGRVEDRGLAALLAYLRTAPPPSRAGRKRLLIITTRWRIPDLRGDGIVTRDVGVLSKEEGADLLQQFRLLDDSERALRFRPPRSVSDKTAFVRAEFEQAAEEYGGHALALVILASYLLRCYDGDLAQRSLIEKIPANHDDAQYRHARRIMSSYDRFFERRTEPELKACRQLLCLIGLFDRPVESSLVRTVRQAPAIPGLTDALQKEDQFQQAVSELRRLHLLSPATDCDSHLDAHPLVREHFGKMVKSCETAAWRKAHARLFEYLSQIPKCVLPLDLRDLEPLHRAVAHGCQAGLHKKAWENVYWPRIKRGQERFNTLKLYAFGSDLTTLSWFFDVRWTKLTRTIGPDWKPVVLDETAFALRSLGRLREAIEPGLAALKSHVRKGNRNRDPREWEQAAMNAGGVGLLLVILGDLNDATRFSRQAVEYADLGKSSLERVRQRGNLANALLQRGYNKEARDLFDESQEIIAKVSSQENVPQSHWFCDVLLDSREYHRVLDLAGPSNPGRTHTGIAPLDQALWHAARGKAVFELSRSELAVDRRAVQEQSAITELHSAVECFRTAKTEHHLPRGLLARAELHRNRGDYVSAREDLQEALEIATSDPHSRMKLYEADCCLCLSNLFLCQQQVGNARAFLSKASSIVEETHYLRRKPDIDALQSKIEFDGIG